jgi:hypothetical protein
MIPGKICGDGRRQDWASLTLALSTKWRGSRG